MKLKKFDHANLKIIREALDQAFASIEKDFGVKCSIGNIRFNSSSFHSQFKAELDVSDNPVEMKRKEEANEEISKALGFNKNVIGEKFMSNGTIFTVVELAPGRPKYPIVAANPTGTRYKFTKTVKFLNKEIKIELLPWEK